MIFDGKYKFTRYFSLQQHHIPETPEILRRYNDLELYDLQSDPQEMHNLAADKQYSSLVDHMNDKLNRLYRKEIGTKDDGHYIPPLKGLKWSLDPEVTAYLLRD